MTKYTFRTQLRGRGCFAEIHFSAEYSDNQVENLVVEYHADRKWEESTRAGIVIFFEYLSIVKNRKIRVTIHRINWMPTDTNNLIILYAVIDALKNHFKLNIDELDVDKDNETFNFPEPRKSLFE